MLDDDLIMVTCPATGEVVSTGFAAAPSLLPKLMLADTGMICSACGARHIIGKSADETAVVVRS